MPLPRDDMHARHPTGTDVSESEQLFYFPRMDPPPHHHQHQHQQQQQPQPYTGGLNTSSGSLIRHRNNLSSFSLSSHVSVPSRVSTLEAYELIYGDGPVPGATTAETVERLYEVHADSFSCPIVTITSFHCNEPVYENPLITASSRQIIGDINDLSRQLRELDVPRPLAMFKTLFRPSNSYGEANDGWFRALRVWSEIDEIYDSETFDGHRLSIIEHTLNILILPGLHSDGRGGGTEQHAPDIDSSSVVSLPAAGGHVAPKPALVIPGLRQLPIPSPLHLKLHVISRLSFNEQGRIARHRDFWDVRDVFGLVPGVRAAQWIGTRVAAHGLAWAARLTGWAFGRKKEFRSGDNDVEFGMTPAASPVSAHSQRADSHGLNALGLHFSESTSGSSVAKTTLGVPPRRNAPLTVSSASRVSQSQAPDVDRDAE